MNLFGTYCGIVKENRDPTKLGRLKVFVPTVFGVSGETTEEIGLENLPWALPVGLPAGGSSASGGIDWLPEVGDQVFVRFLDGEPEKPIWEWGMQTIDQSNNLKLHDYDALSKKPKRAGLTRYGNTIDMTDGQIVITSKSGYTLAITDGPLQDGKINIKSSLGNEIAIDDTAKTMTLQTPLGQQIQLDDKNAQISIFATETAEVQVLEEVSIQCANMKIQAFGERVNILSFSEIKLTVSGVSLTISPAGFNFSAG